MGDIPARIKVAADLTDGEFTGVEAEARPEGSRKKAVVPIVDVLFVEQIKGL